MSGGMLGFIAFGYEIDHGAGSLVSRKRHELTFGIIIYIMQRYKLQKNVNFLGSIAPQLTRGWGFRNCADVRTTPMEIMRW